MTRQPVVYLVDDDDSFRDSLARVLSTSGFRVESFASAGDFLISEIRSSPACLILDVNMPGPSGLDLQDALVKRGTGIPVIFLTGHGDIPMTVRAMRAGAIDFLTKPVERSSLVDAVRRAIDLSERNSVQHELQNSIRHRFEQLTSREREVFAEVLSGKLNKQIAAGLGISERTVKAHRAQIMAKMEAGSLAELVQMAAHIDSEGDSA